MSQIGYQETLRLLTKKNIKLSDIADLAIANQAPYGIDYDRTAVINVIDHILQRDDIQDIITLAINIDELVQNDQLSPYINERIKSDVGLFGVDELIVSGIYNLYGQTGVTNYGYTDKMKPGIIGEIDRRGKTTAETTTFLDDIVGALVAATVSYLAHHQEELEQQKIAQRQSHSLNKPIHHIGFSTTLQSKPLDDETYDIVRKLMDQNKPLLNTDHISFRNHQNQDDDNVFDLSMATCHSRLHPDHSLQCDITCPKLPLIKSPLSTLTSLKNDATELTWFQWQLTDELPNSNIFDNTPLQPIKFEAFDEDNVLKETITLTH